MAKADDPPGTPGASPWRDRMDAWGEKVFRGRFAQQFAALFYKNVLVAWRSRRATAIRLLAPFVFLLLALVINLALEANNASQARIKDAPAAGIVDMGAIPDCHRDLFIGPLRDCIDFVYTPAGDEEVEALISRVRTNNAPPIPADRVKGFPDRAASDAWMLANGDAALGGVHFGRDARGNLQYILQSNSTVKYFKGDFQDPSTFFQVPMMNAVAREAARAALLRRAPERAGAFSWAPRLLSFPHPYLDSRSLLAGVLAAFIFAALMFGFVTQMTNLVSEREAGLRTALRNMGMLDSSYWASWAAFDALMALAGALLIVIFGLILQFPYFKANDTGLLFVLFWLFGLAMTSYSYCLSVFMKKTQGAVYLGFVVFICGWIFQTVQIGASLPYSPTYYYSKTNVWGRVFFWVFNLFPWNPLTKGIVDLGAATAAASSPGLRWGQRYSYCSYVPAQDDQEPYDTKVEYRDYNCVFPIGQAYTTMLLQWLLYLLAAVYLNNVLPNELGARRPWYYPVLPSYWRPRPAATAAALQKAADGAAARRVEPRVSDGGGEAEEEVAAEEDRMRALLRERVGKGGDAPDAARFAAELYGLSKVFPGGRSNVCGVLPCGRRNPDFWAIKGSWFGIEKGQLFCLLGPNGAGKTTTINCLTGVLPISGGDALIYGEPISSEGGLDRVRPLMGVCPQFDVLWGELTGEEHLNIYGHVKGLPFATVRRQAAELLEKVKLSYAAGARSGSYSGGMKRRLSVAIALLGDSRVVYLDEPTTGMDPISRRYVWDIIQEAKAGRAIVLTTHSMEEADILGDRIAIMARGRVRAIGSSLRLKQRFGAGYVLAVSPAGGGRSYADLPAMAAAVAGRATAIRDFIRSELGLEPSEETRSYLSYLVEREREAALVGLLARLEERRDELGVGDVQLSLTSLEDVFLAIARQAELEHAAATGSTLVSVDLPNGSRVMVALGEEAASDPADGSRWRVKWSQDDTGKLVVLGAEPWDGGAAAGAAPPGAPPKGGGGLTAKLLAGSGGSTCSGSGGGSGGGALGVAVSADGPGAERLPSVATPGRWDICTQTVERYSTAGGFQPAQQ
ncbi:MAG: hypothetical protein J3K34DRAFT_204610 [Monoraphidium minutum]|nr:MAG: hypothetical protein J3K34DRAFT_204610 [Monoraphidium minutum]